MNNGFGGLLGTLVGLAIFTTIASRFLGKGASGIWGGVKSVKHKVSKEGSFW